MKLMLTNVVFRTVLLFTISLFVSSGWAAETDIISFLPRGTKTFPFIS